jgi:hypothetical protein
MYDQLVNETNLKAQENPFLKTPFILSCIRPTKVLYICVRVAI